MVLIISVNIYTLSKFYNGTLLPPQSWKTACTIIQNLKPDKVFFYPSHRMKLVKYYCPDLPTEGLPFYESEMNKEFFKHVNKFEKNILVIAHESRPGIVYLNTMIQLLNKPKDYSTNNIKIYFFNQPSLEKQIEQ